MAPAIARTAVRIARRHGLPVFAHTSDRAGLRVALDAGVDVIAHVLDTTEGTAPLLREAADLGRWLVPTLDMFAQTVTRDPAYIDPIHASLNLFREGGGRLLFGTDAGYLPDHDPSGEFAALHACGLGVDDVLAMLTTRPATAFGTGTGTIAPRRGPHHDPCRASHLDPGHDVPNGKRIGGLTGRDRTRSGFAGKEPKSTPRCRLR
jgi:imidazolonepropionase-like amidohydrolase